MEQVQLKGDILFSDGWSEGSILLQGSEIIDVSDSRGTDLKADRTIEGLIIPGFMDMHTHLGDLGARGMLPASLEETVFPGGTKHVFLDSASDDELISSIRASIEEIHHGVTFLMDYREGGLRSIKNLMEASSSGGPFICSLPRFVVGEDPLKLLRNSSGIGQPSLSSASQALREMVKQEGKIFSVHASELFREDIDKILKLEPDQIVHMISGSSSDREALVEANIPVVVCPRSNRAYGLDVPLHDMVRSGLSLSLGTDNSLSIKQDMFREMESAWILLRSGKLEGSEASGIVFDMAVGRSLEGNNLWTKLPAWTKWWENGWPRKGDPAHLFVLERSDGGLWRKDPFSQIVRFSDRSQVVFTPSFPPYTH